MGKRDAAKKDDQHQGRSATMERVQEIRNRSRQRSIGHTGEADKEGTRSKSQRKELNQMRKRVRRRADLAEIQRKDLLLVLLLKKGVKSKNEPLDRIRVMKSLFLLSQEEPRLSKTFKFEPYLYGAVSFDVYTELDALQRSGLIATTKEFQNDQWNRYFLTHKGVSEAQATARRIPKTIVGRIERIKKYTTSKQTYELLKEVYAKYPNFAAKSVIRFPKN